MTCVFVLTCNTFATDTVKHQGDKMREAQEHENEQTQTSGAAPKGIARLFSAFKRHDAGAPSDKQAAEVPDFVKSGYVFLDQELSTRDEALTFISNKAVELGLADEAPALVEAFLSREAEGTTGMMEGFAIPHAKTPSVREAAILVVKDPAGITDWDTMDAKPVHVAIALLIPGAQAGTTHLRMLSKVAEALMDEQFRSTVRDSTDAAEIARAVNEHLA